MGAQIKGLAFLAVGYTIAYWAINILVDSYAPKSTRSMNPAPLAVLFGLGSPVGAPRTVAPTHQYSRANPDRRQWHKNPTAANPNPNIFAQMSQGIDPANPNGPQIVPGVGSGGYAG